MKTYNLLIALACLVLVYCAQLKVWPDEDDAPFGPYSDEYAPPASDSGKDDDNDIPDDVNKYVDTNDQIVPDKPEIDHSNANQAKCDAHALMKSSAAYFHGNTELVYTELTPENNVCPMAAGKASCCHPWTLYQMDVSLTATRDKLMELANTVGTFPSDLRDQVNVWESEGIKVGFIQTDTTLCDLVDSIGYRVCDTVYNLATFTNEYAKGLHDTLSTCIDSLYDYYHGVSCLMCEMGTPYLEESKLPVTNASIHTLKVNSSISSVVSQNCMPYFNIQVEWMKAVSNSIFGKDGLDSGMFGLKDKLEKKIDEYGSKSVEAVQKLAQKGLAGIYVDRIFDVEFFGGIDAVMDIWSEIVAWANKLGANSVDESSEAEAIALSMFEKNVATLAESKTDKSVFQVEPIVNSWDSKNKSFDPLLLIMEPTKAELIENIAANKGSPSSNGVSPTMIITSVCVVVVLALGIVGFIKRDVLVKKLKQRKKKQYVMF